MKKITTTVTATDGARMTVTTKSDQYRGTRSHCTVSGDLWSFRTGFGSVLKEFDDDWELIASFHEQLERNWLERE